MCITRYLKANLEVFVPLLLAIIIISLKKHAIVLLVAEQSVYGQWVPLEPCSVTCGGGETPQSRSCIRGPCPDIFRVVPCGTESCNEGL